MESAVLPRKVVHPSVCPFVRLWRWGIMAT